MSGSMYRLIVVFAAGMVLGATFPSAAPAVTSNDAASVRRVEASRGSVRLRGFRDAEMDFQIIRSIGADAFGGGALGDPDGSGGDRDARATWRGRPSGGRWLCCRVCGGHRFVARPDDLRRRVWLRWRGGMAIAFGRRR